MTDTAVRVAGPVTINNTETTLYTVPAATKAIIRNIRICNSASSSVTVKASIGADAIGTRIIASGYALPANGDFDWTGFLVLDTGETLRATAGSAASLTATVSGVEVT